MKPKTHYQKAHKSSYLRVADLDHLIQQGNPLIFTIKEVKQEINIRVAGIEGNYNIAYFIENIKPLVLNTTNSKTIKTFNHNSDYIEDWQNTVVQLYIDKNVKHKGETVGGIRIKTKQPQLNLKPPFTQAHFQKAYDNNITIQRIKKTRIVTPQTEEHYNQFVATQKNKQAKPTKQLNLININTG